VHEAAAAALSHNDNVEEAVLADAKYDASETVTRFV